MEWSCSTFVLVFRVEFIPKWVVEKRKDEFQNLNQGGMSVVQYTVEFNCLSKYCHRLVDTEQNRTRQLIKRHRPELRRALAPFSRSNYSRW
jgi:hypothetical protein